MALSPRRTIRYYTLKFIHLRGNPKSLAMGAAVGILIGISPTIPFHTGGIIAVTVLMRVSTVAAFITATAICNPLTMVPQYYICWFVGDLIFPDRLTWERINEVLHIITTSSFKVSMETLGSLSFDAILVMLTGGFVIGIPVAIGGYYYSLRFFIKIQEKRRQKHVLN